MTKKNIVLTKDSIELFRIKEVLEIIPVSKSTWWAGVKEGKFPKPVKISEGITAWRGRDLFELIDSLEEAV